MFNRVFSRTMLRTLVGSFIYDNYWVDFINGFCLRISPTPRYIPLRKGCFKIKINDNNDLMTINEVFSWQIYNTERALDYKYVFDLGSNIGSTAVYFAEFKNVKRIFCFEPDPAILATLTENCNALSVDVNITNKAVTSNGNDVILNIAYSSRYNSIEKSDSFNYLSSVKVQSISFDDWFAMVAKFNSNEVLIKIDIEGIEAELLKYLDNKNIFIGDIIVEGENLPRTFGKYILRSKKFDNIYFYSEHKSVE